MRLPWLRVRAWRRRSDCMQTLGTRYAYSCLLDELTMWDGFRIRGMYEVSTRHTTCCARILNADGSDEAAPRR